MRDAAEELKRLDAVHNCTLALRHWCSAANGDGDHVLWRRLADPANKGEVVVLKVPRAFSAVSVLQPDLCSSSFATVGVPIHSGQLGVEGNT